MQIYLNIHSNASTYYVVYSSDGQPAGWPDREDCITSRISSKCRRQQVTNDTGKNQLAIGNICNSLEEYPAQSNAQSNVMQKILNNISAFFIQNSPPTLLNIILFFGYSINTLFYASFILETDLKDQIFYFFYIFLYYRPPVCFPG